MMALVRILNAIVDAGIGVPAYRCVTCICMALLGFMDAPYSCVCAGTRDSQTSSSTLAHKCYIHFNSIFSES